MTPGKRGKEANEPKAPTVSYLTDCLLLDITGGGKLAGKEKKSLTEPANFLLLDKDGVLIVHNELEDLPELERHTEPQGPANVAGPDQGRNLQDLYEGPKIVKPKGKGKKNRD